MGPFEKKNLLDFLGREKSVKKSEGAPQRTLTLSNTLMKVPIYLITTFLPLTM